MSVLSGDHVARFCTSYAKINPNGVDLAPKLAMRIPPGSTIYIRGDLRGYIDSSGAVTDPKTPLEPDHGGFYRFEKGNLYELRFPRVSIPDDCTGFAFPRSTMNRLGLMKLETAIFDSGYSGEPSQTIFAPIDAVIHKDEALVQLVFIRNEARAQELYRGRYQNEEAR